MTRFRIYPDDHLASAAQTDLLAWMAAERSGLLMQLADLDERTLCQQAVTGGWTAKDLLAHVAYKVSVADRASRPSKESRTVSTLSRCT
jgi:hypothetical protein